MPTAALSPCAWACPAQTSLTDRTSTPTLLGHANPFAPPLLLPLPSLLLLPVGFL